MKKVIGLVVALCAFAVSAVAHAATVEYTFEAKVSASTDASAKAFQELGLLERGETSGIVRGTFSFDTEEIKGGEITIDDLAFEAKPLARRLKPLARGLKIVTLRKVILSSGLDGSFSLKTSGTTADGDRVQVAILLTAAGVKVGPREMLSMEELLKSKLAGDMKRGLDLSSLNTLDLGGLAENSFSLTVSGYALKGQLSSISSGGGGVAGVPELSTGSAASSIGLLAGGALVLSSRRRHSDAA